MTSRHQRRRRRPRMAWVASLTGLALAVVLLPAAPASARTSTTVPAGAGYSTALLAPPTGLTFTKTCSTSSTITLRWTATTSPYATGYQLNYTQNGTAAAPQTIAGRTTVTMNYPITNGAIYNATLATTYRNWTSTTNPTTGNFNC